MHVSIVLWLLAGMTKRRRVQVQSRYLREAGLDRHATYRALKALEAARLVEVVRVRGRSPVVTILDCPTEDLAPPGGMP